MSALHRDIHSSPPKAFAHPVPRNLCWLASTIDSMRLKVAEYMVSHPLASVSDVVRGQRAIGTSLTKNQIRTIHDNLKERKEEYLSILRTKPHGVRARGRKASAYDAEALLCETVEVYRQRNGATIVMALILLWHVLLL